MPPLRRRLTARWLHRRRLVYPDRLEPVVHWLMPVNWPDGRCAKCGAPKPDGDGPDPCLGTLPGVMFACCGHGYRDYSYVMFRDGTTIRGFDRVEPHP